jgi:hypothetical protein
MKDHESLELLRNANPVSVEPDAVRSPRATATLARIVSEPRTAGDVMSPSRRARRDRGGWRSFGLAAGGVAGIAAAVAAILVLVVSGGSAAPAFARWTPSPAIASAARIAAVTSACGLGRPALVDARGPYTAAVFVKRSGGTACVIGPGIGLGVFSLGGVKAPDNRFTPDQIGTAAAAGSDSSGHAYVLLAGRVGTAVRSIVIHRSNNIDVTATIKNGWYLAWWPAHARATDATITTTSGARTVSLPPLATTGPPSCGSGHATACAAVGAGSDSNGPGSAGAPGPPLIQGPVAKPFNRTLLLVVDNAARVLVCFDPPANLTVAMQPNGPTGPCSNADRLSRLPARWPVQRNLLELFPNSVWVIKLPAGTPSHAAQPVLVVALGTAGNSQIRDEITLN